MSEDRLTMNRLTYTYATCLARNGDHRWVSVIGSKELTAQRLFSQVDWPRWFERMILNSHRGDGFVLQDPHESISVDTKTIAVNRYAQADVRIRGEDVIETTDDMFKWHIRNMKQNGFDLTFSYRNGNEEASKYIRELQGMISK